MPAPDSFDPSGGAASSDVSRRRRQRLALLATIVVLYVISVPWYRSVDAPLSIWFGLPDWVAVALGCYVLTAALNSIAWALTDVHDGDPSEPEAPTAEPET
jgi:multidrug efflux pump subunit AcrB